MSEATRTHRRFNLSLPLWVGFRERIQGRGRSRKGQASEIGTSGEEETITTNIGSGGCFFYASKKPPIGASATMLINVPGRIGGAPTGKVLCRGKVVRVSEEKVPGKVGVACTIDSYKFKPVA